MKLSLTAKTLILISAPLCFVVGFVVLLTNLERQAEQDAQNAVRARELSDCINGLTADIITSFDRYGTNDRIKWLKKGYLDQQNKALVGRMRGHYAVLTRLTAKDPDLSKAVSNSSHSLDQAAALMEQAAKDIDTGHVDALMDNYPAKMDQLRTHFHKMLSQELILLERQQREIADTSAERQSLFRAQVILGAVGVFIAVLIATISQAYFLMKNVTSRIQVINENSRKLSLGQPLNKPLSGNDEIAELDQLFHSMATSIDEVARMKQELVLMLTHDMRSPLTAIQGSLDMLRHQSQEFDERSQRLISLADRNSARMASLIDDLLDIQKIKSGMMTLNQDQVCLAEIFEEVRENVNDWIAEHGIHLEIEDTALFVKGDESKLSRVVFNLVSNAIKYSPPGGTIKIEAKNFRAGQVEVLVCDQGPGIPADMIDSIFERFQQVDTQERKSKGGSGLGLAVCQAIIGLHGGRIWVTSESGQGSTFHFTLAEG